MGMFDTMKDKASELAGQHSDQVEEYSDQGLDRGEQMADQRFGEQHAEQVDKGRDMLDDRIGGGGGDEGQTPP